MEYLAHISEDKKREQTLQEHLEGTAKLAGQFADAFGYKTWGYYCGKLHDIGKYSEKFQRRIRGGEEIVDHATAGAQLCCEKRGFYNAIGYCIAGHHSGLPDTGERADTADRGTYVGRMKKKVECYQAYKDEIAIPVVDETVFDVTNQKDPSFSMSFLIRMLFSCLVDADYLNTEDFMKNGEANRQAGENMEILLRKLRLYISGWMENKDQGTVNGRRTEILRHCMEKGKELQGLFYLTVPTGGGKTVASLAFALQHAVEHNLDHIIYVIPYTSIIEQNAKIFANILGADNVLEHHSNMNYESHEELKPMQLASENWDKPVIVTTNVQFFESLFSNKSTKCRKLHNLANSVIIFDEAQMLPNDYLKPCVAAMEELLSLYRSSIVLCTATQPYLHSLFSDKISFQELCPRTEEQFDFFQRTLIENLGRISQEKLREKLRSENQALCILNTKADVRKLYEDIMEEGVYHLSTLMYPIHRKRMLNRIKTRLKSGRRCIVIATSLVEAGVDLDFHSVYRQLAGVDSMIQAAGRCNREGERSRKESYTYIFELEETAKVPGQEQQIETAKQIMRKYEDISDLKAIQEYFVRLYNFKGQGLDRKRILEQFQKRRFPFAKVSKEFKIIEQNTKTILIAKEERAKEIAEELRIKGATKALIREAGQYCVNIYENIFERIYGAGMLVEISEDLREDFFLLRVDDDYSEEMGLNISVELGNGIWY